MLVFGVIAGHLLTTLSHNSKGHSQDINRAHATGNQVQYRNSDQFPVESIALMPRSELLLVGICLCDRGRRSLDAGAEEALKVLGLPTRDVIAVDLGLVLDEKVKLRLGDRVTFDIDFEAMGRLQGTFGGRIDWPLDVAILRLVDCRHHVEVALSVSLFPAQLVSSRSPINRTRHSLS